MPQVKTKDKIHVMLRPYVFHGLDLTNQPNSKGWVYSLCPGCGREDLKFGVNAETGAYKCFTCDLAGGGIYLFLRWLHAESDRTTKDYAELQTDRKLLYPDTLMRWGICKSVIGGEWLVPGYNPEGSLTQLYRRVRSYPDNRIKLLPTPELPHALHWVGKPTTSQVLVCEGPWDGMALEETLGLARETAAGLEVTADKTSSLLNKFSVVAVPGCMVWNEPWCGIVGGKSTLFLYDSDHSRTHPTTGEVIAPAGLAGVRAAVRKLLGSDGPKPTSIGYLSWGLEGYDPALPSGYDVRDALTGGGNTPEGRVRSLGAILERLTPIPAEWLSSSGHGTSGGGEECLPCESWDDLILDWRKAMKWIDGLDHGLAAMLATIISTPTAGDQLWVKLLGVPSSGKSTLAEAVSMARKYVKPKDTMTSLTSGYQVDKEGSENLSLVEMLRGKTLIIKDADSVLTHPNVNAIMGQLRAFYDRAIRTQYGNKMSTDHENSNTTVIFCGTPRLKLLNRTEMGERFLDVRVVEEMDEDLEDEIGWRKACQASRESALVSNGQVVSETPEMTRAKQRTGGYVKYLRENAEELLSGVEIPEDCLRTCQLLGKFVSYARARPHDDKNSEEAARELSFRLISQMVKLARCLAAVLNRDKTDEEVMARVRRVALDTAKGTVLTMMSLLDEAGDLGMPVSVISLHTGNSEEEDRKLLRFLRKIHAVQVHKEEDGSARLWSMTSKVWRLYREVMHEQPK